MNELKPSSEDRSAKTVKHKDYRRCVSCRKVAARSEFWRVVKCHPTNTIAIDLGDTWRQGRSAYLCPTASCLQLAQKKNRLGRSLKAAIPESIYQQLGILKFTHTAIS
jgi:uncharacterized protein